MNRQRDVLFYLEFHGEKWKDNKAGLLAEGKRIADGLGGTLNVLVPGLPLDSPGDFSILEEFGTSTLYVLNGQGLSEYRGEVYAWAISEFLKQYPPRLLLFTHDGRGQELAPRIAHILGTMAVTDCVDIQVDEQRLTMIKPFYEDCFQQEIRFSSGKMEIITLRPGFLGWRQVAGVEPMDVREIFINVPPEIEKMARTEHLGLLAEDVKTMDIEQARLILGAGMGTLDEEIIPLVQELAKLLNGSMGATRPMVDEGILPKERMIGLTGKRVAPELYLALGISGSQHHMTGMQDSKKIIAINSDPQAAIYQFSDIGIVGDLKGILPKLVKRIKAHVSAGHSPEMQIP